MPPRHPLLDHFGARVRSLRKTRGWSRRELAERTGISERFLADVESGRGNPSLLKVVELAQVLEVPVDSLLRVPERVPATGARRSIALLGLRGAGKSTIGRQLAARLGLPFTELDQRIEEEAGLGLAELFQLHGEAYYREAERRALESLLSDDQVRVIATGGGVVTAPASYGLLKRKTHTVWLRAAPEDHWNRVLAQGDMRPMADNERAFSDLCSILAERERLYRHADVTIDTSSHSVEDAVAQLVRRFSFLAA